jgi:hypothetical protein
VIWTNGDRHFAGSWILRVDERLGSQLEQLLLLPTETTAHAMWLATERAVATRGSRRQLARCHQPFFAISLLRRRHGPSAENGKHPSDFRRGAFSLQNTFAYSAASFSFFSGRTLRRTEAGFAANHLSSPENGSLPKRFFFAGTSCATTFSRPGSVNSFAPFL